MELENNKDQQMLKIKTRDNEQFQVPKMISEHIKLFDQILQDSSHEEEIQIDITSKSFQLIVNFYEIQQYEPRKYKLPTPLPSGDLQNFIDEKDALFLSELSDEQLFELIQATSYLDSTELYELCCAQVASLFKKCTHEELKKRFYVTEELNPEMEQMLLSEYKQIMQEE